MDWRDRDRLWPLVVGGAAGKCNVCGQTTELLRFGDFLLCKECFAWAGAQAAATAAAAQRFPRHDVLRLHNAGQLAERCEWEGCGRVPHVRRGHFRFCEKHAAEIDERDPCVDCQAGNCGVHMETET
jgi:hypothetical protein